MLNFVHKQTDLPHLVRCTLPQIRHVELHSWTPGQASIFPTETSQGGMHTWPRSPWRALVVVNTGWCRMIFRGRYWWHTPLDLRRLLLLHGAIGGPARHGCGWASAPAALQQGSASPAREGWRVYRPTKRVGVWFEHTFGIMVRVPPQPPYVRKMTKAQKFTKTTPGVGGPRKSFMHR